MKMKLHALALFIAAAIVPAANAGVIDRAQAQGTPATATWSAWGGQIGLRWNHDLLGNLGMTLGKAPTARLATQDWRHHEWFELRQSGGLQFTVANSALRQFTGGSVQMRGGFELKLRDGSTIDLRDLTLRARTDGSNVLDVVSGDGSVWLYSDSLMFRLADNDRGLEIVSANIRMSSALANRIGVPEAAGWNLGDIAMNTQIFVQGVDNAPDRVCSPYPWPDVAVPGVPGAVYKADLFMQATQYDPVGCQGCDGPGGADGIASIAPNSTLRNNVNDGTAQPTIPGDPNGTSSNLYTANVAWHQMFSGVNDPYGNDQHPFLIWNMYRFNPDGSIEQIGRSGVKHAFLTINAGCLDSCNNFDSLGRGCGDTYGSGNNDSPWDMGPRSEIVPATGIWGRCGSIWDAPCSGTQHDNGNSSWSQRMKVHESQIDPAANAGATYMMESWYIARDDTNIYNSMGTITGTPHWSGGTWSLTGQANFKLGPAVDKWVSPTAPPPNSMNTELAVTEGHAKLAVKATDLGGGSWRYDYAVENVDFARAVTQPPANGPDPRVLSNKGFDSFSVPIPAGANVTATSFRDGDLEANNNWSTSTSGGSVTWRAMARPVISPTAPRGQTLDWGSMFVFSVTVNRAPGNGSGALHVATSGSPASYNVATLIPAN
ncbi:MAG TPA: hypothetical protein VKB52_14055 [Rhodanobacteraceae bacterium]|nr:hypothetical protein [Rhodanobacteraceae bacterium]